VASKQRTQSVARREGTSNRGGRRSKVTTKREEAQNQSGKEHRTSRQTKAPKQETSARLSKNSTIVRDAASDRLSKESTRQSAKKHQTNYSGSKPKRSAETQHPSSLIQLLQHRLHVLHQPVRQPPGEVLPDDHPQRVARRPFPGVRHGVGRDDPAVSPQVLGEVELVEAAAVLHPEGDQGRGRDVGRRGHNLEGAQLAEGEKARVKNPIYSCFTARLIRQPLDGASDVGFADVSPGTTLLGYFKKWGDASGVSWARSGGGARRLLEEREGALLFQLSVMGATLLTEQIMVDLQMDSTLVALEEPDRTKICNPDEDIDICVLRQERGCQYLCRRSPLECGRLDVLS
jgi:hypothetical protein